MSDPCGTKLQKTETYHVNLAFYYSILHCNSSSYNPAAFRSCCLISSTNHYGCRSFSAIGIVRAINKEDEYAKKISHPPTHPLTDNLLNILHSVN